ncbi:hypothetical protein H5410_013712, partial [Solanum commersonii]
MTTSQTSPPKYLQEDSLSKEYKKLLSTLPKEKGWIGSHIYKYQGFWTSPRLIQGVIACQQQFQAQDTDIILVTTPKSGTTWLKSLLFALVNRTKHSVFEQNHPLLVKNPHVLVPFLEHTLYVDGQVPDFSSFTSPRLLATHEENCGVVDEILKMCSFENLSNLKVNTNEKLPTGEGNKTFFRKEEIGDWKNYFTVEMSENLNRITEQKFHGFGL